MITDISPFSDMYENACVIAIPMLYVLLIGAFRIKALISCHGIFIFL